MVTRVLHVMPHPGGGAETYIDMLERLPGFEHHRFYLSAGRTPASAVASIPLRWPQLAAGLRSVEVLHSHGDVASVIALPLLRTRPAVMTCQGLHMLRRLEGPRRALMARALAGVLRACRAVICSSESERDELATLAPGRTAEKLFVIHNGVDPAPALGEADRLSLRSELGADASTVLGLFVGQLEPRKAPLLAARAAARAAAEGAPFRLVVAGSGPQEDALRAVDSDAVRLLGFRGDVPRLLGAADVFVHPSEREGMSFALLEAMAQGLAIVAANGSSNPEALAGAGLLFEPGDETSLVEAIRQLSADEALRQSLGARAKARALEQFSPASFLDASREVYVRALERRQG